MDKATGKGQCKTVCSKCWMTKHKWTVVGSTFSLMASWIKQGRFGGQLADDILSLDEELKRKGVS